MNINIPIVLSNSNNKVIITSSNVPIKPADNLRLIQNSNLVPTVSSQYSSISQICNQDHEFFRKYSKEIFVKFRGVECDKQIDILQFNNDGSLDQNLNTKEMFLQRDRSQNLKTNQGLMYGAGTEFSKESRDDAWQRKFVLNKKKNDFKDPINLCIGRGRNTKKYKAVKESMLENSQYCVFIRSSADCFEAISVKDWYKMQPEVISKFSKLEDAIDELNKLDRKSESSSSTFKKRYSIEIDEFMRSKKMKKHDEDSDVYNGTGLIVTSNDRDNFSDSSIEEERELVKKRKTEALVTKLRLGKERDYEESDVDDHQGDEVDYMTHSSSNEDNLPDLEKEKIYAVNNVDEDVVSKSDDEISNMDEEKNPNENVDETIKETNDIESNSDSYSSNDSSPMTSMDDSDDEDNNLILKHKLSCTINKNVANQLKLNFRSQSSTEALNCDGNSRKYRHDDAQNTRTIQEMYKYLTRKPISKSNLLKKLITKKLLNTESQKTFDGLLDRINTVTHIVNGEKLFSIIN